jgi:hypothetical protein
MKKGMILWCVLIVWISALGLELLPARALARTPYDVWFRGRIRGIQRGTWALYSR